MTDQVANFTEVVVSGTYDDAATEITLSSGEGAKLPDPSGDNYNLVWYNYSSYPGVFNDPKVEIVRVTAKTDDVITVTRNQEGTGASTKSDIGTYKMMLTPTAKTITDLQAEIDADVTAHAGNSDAHHNETHTLVSHDTTVTGAELNADHSKLSGIDTGAKDDQTGAEIKTAYEGEADTNEFSDAEKTKLGTVDTDADVTGSNAPQAHEASHEALGSDELDFDQLADGTTYKKFLATERTKLTGIEASADVNNISDADVTDLTDAGDSVLHYHATDRARANHTGTQVAATISDFDTEVENNSKVSGIEASADVTDAANVASSIVGVAAKATPVDADTIPLIDSVDASSLKEVLWSQVKATLKTYFDTLYDVAGGLTTHVADTSTHGVAEVADVATVSAEIDGDITTHKNDTDAHHAQAHSVASHNDTTVTGAELDADHSKLGGVETSADVTDAVNIASSIIGVDGKATPVDGDSIGIIDSAAANVLKELTWANIKATLKTYFDGLYNNYSHPNHTGEVTSTGDGATVIVDDAVTYAKMQNVSADERILGNVTAIGSPVAELTKAQVLSMLSVEDGSTADQTGAEIKTAYEAEANAYTDTKNTKLAGIDTGADVTADNAPKAHEASHKATGGDEILLDEFGTPTDVTTLNATTSLHGLLPKLGGGSTNYLRADGTWAEPPGGGGAVVASGTYTGNDTTNRAIAHGLGTAPKLVMLVEESYGYSFRIIRSGYTNYVSDGSNLEASVTAADNTNFYVGNAANLSRSANATTVNYHWVAIG